MDKADVFKSIIRGDEEESKENEDEEEKVVDVLKI